MFDFATRYPAYEDSGEPWLGQVPHHWKLRRTKTVLRERSDKGHPHEPPLAATQTKGVVRKDEYENRTVLALKDLHLLKLVREGDFVISLRSFQGGIEYARHRGIISPAYTVLYLMDPDVHAYLAWLFKSHPYIENLSLHVTGIRQGQNIDYEKLGRSRLPVPPHEDRVQIVRFLDRTDRRIRRYIAAKRTLLGLLNEQKQAIIDHAVTRGLDPNVRLKPSGVEWLGEVPEHWDVRRVQGIFRERNEKGQSGWPILAVSIAHGVTRGDETDEDGRPRRLIDDRGLYKLAHEGDIAYNTMRMWQGAVGVVPVDGLVSPAYVVAEPRPQMNATFFTLVFRTDACRGDTVGRSRGIVDDRNRLYWDSFKDLRVPVPPCDEQDAIVNAVTAETHALASSVEHLSREIALLVEYRTRLIADVVTGKLDVREAARLPDEVEEPVSLDGLDALAEGDRAEDDAALDVGSVEDEA